MRTSKKNVCVPITPQYKKKKYTSSVLTFCFHSAIQMHFQKRNGFLDEWEMDGNPPIKTYEQLGK